MKKNHILKRLLTSLLCLVLFLSGTALAVRAASGEKTSEVLVVGIPSDRCPIFYEDSGTGEPAGIGVDLMRIAAEEAGYSPSFRFIREESLKEALDNDDYDVLMPFGSTVESAAGHQSIVSENLLQTPFTLVTSKLAAIPPLNELRVGMPGSLAAGAETVRQMYPGIEIVFYDSMPECVQALRDGDVDALLHNSYVWSYILQKPSYKDLAVQPSAMFSMDFRAGTLDTPKGRSVIRRLNDGIAKLDDTRRQAVILDYTSRSLYQYDLADYLYLYGLIILMGVLLIVAVIIIAAQRVSAVRKEHEKKMRQMIDHDPLTGILSMNGFRKKAEELIYAHPDSPYFLSYNNIRDFKFINDSLGRDAGDELLKFWALRTIENLSEEEAAGRVSADHFVVLRRIEGEEQMRSDEKKVLEPVQNFFLDQGKENRVRITSGIYVLTAKDFRNADIDHMLDLARVAEKRARENRSSDYAFYNPEQWEKGRQIADVVNYLPEAIRAGDIKVWYQPQVNYETGEISGAEALCRWEHTKLGSLYPSSFISILEDAGLIFELDRFVWDRVCKDLKRWNDSGYHRSVSVNVSRGDIREDRDIPGHFNELIKTYGLDPDQIRIEITETAYAESPGLLITATEKLQSYGFRVEMDDFGSGYSSLHMLKEVPVDRIKLDLHFLTESGDPEKSRVIVSSVIRMMEMLGLDLIAEGVETVEQADFLKSRGCSEMQGYYFHKPLPVREFEKICQMSVSDKNSYERL